MGFPMKRSVRYARVGEIVRRLNRATKTMEKPAASQIIATYGKNPYLILISCLLSLRTKDKTSFPASRRLFAHARSPQSMVKLPVSLIEKQIYPVSFYRTKARRIISMSRELIERFQGKVPRTREELLSIKGIGIKTASLVLGEAFKIPAICVDTHVHRISNRLGIVKTVSPKKTEAILEKRVPKQYWIPYNPLMVMWGQNICVPVSPKCSQCILYDLCPRIGVKKHR